MVHMVDNSTFLNGGVTCYLDFYADGPESWRSGTEFLLSIQS